MAAKRKKERIISQYFIWLLGRRNGIYYADGRSNGLNLGRHSLGSRDRQEALELLSRLDLVKAVGCGKADRSVLAAAPGPLLSLGDGKQLYLEHVGRPTVLGGATAKTQKRYRAVLDKFVEFASAKGIQTWQSVTKALVESYGAWLDDHGYDYA